MDQTIDPKNGFCSKTKTYHSLRPPAALPTMTAALSITSYIFSSLHRPSSAAALIDSATGRRILHSELQLRVKSLAYSLRHEFKLSKGDCAFILSPNSVDVPILYLSLFALGVVVSPSNPASSPVEILRQLQLSKAVIAFTNADTAHKLPASCSCRTILLDSQEFNSMAERNEEFDFQSVGISQFDTAAIIYSSGTTGNFKGVELTHRNFISSFAGSYASRPARKTPPVTLCTVPIFHVYGFLLVIREAAMGGTVVLMRRVNLELILKSVEEHQVTHLAVAPPIMVAMANNSGASRGFNLGSLEVVFCGGAPLPNSVIEKFSREFPGVVIMQGYGLTETTAGAVRHVGPNESQVLGSVGRLMPGMQARIVDPERHNGPGLGLSPLSQGELWLKGHYIMKGYVGDKEATDAMIDSEGWLRTGDICYFDNEGFLFFVERMKDLIKYKAYQVAPAELEHLLQSHPDITDAAVVPYPDEEAGQLPVAFVVRKRESVVTELQIMDFVAEQVAPYKKIRKVFFADAIPRNAPGKVLRKELIKQAILATASKL